jgi:hypothetical protein
MGELPPSTHYPIGSAMPWFRAALNDIYDVLSFAVVHGFPVIVCLCWLIASQVEPTYLFQ